MERSGFRDLWFRTTESLPSDRDNGRGGRRATAREESQTSDSSSSEGGSNYNSDAGSGLCACDVQYDCTCGARESETRDATGDSAFERGELVQNLLLSEFDGRRLQDKSGDGACNESEKSALLDSDQEEPDDTDSVESSESEGAAEYVPGGYHPVKVGERFKDGRYVVLRKMGWGHFSTVWLCLDVVKLSHVAIKIQKSASHYYDAARDEIGLLSELKLHSEFSESSSLVVCLLDYFELNGIFGTHMCLVFEVLGKSILHLIRRSKYNGASLQLVKLIAYQALLALDFAHTACGIIHTDIKPENILFQPAAEDYQALEQCAVNAARVLGRDDNEFRDPAPESSSARRPKSGKARKRDDSSEDDGHERAGNSGYDDAGARHRAAQAKHSAVVEAATHLSDPDMTFMSGRVKVVDFGNACYTTFHFTEDIQTRQYRSPEVILGCGFNATADVWSLACVLFEVATGDLLFDPHSGRDYERDEDHLALMMELLGPMPPNVALSGTASHEFFTRDGRLRHIQRMNFWPLRDVLHEKYYFSLESADGLSSFLLPMLIFDMDKRATAAEALRHPWLRDVAHLFPAPTPTSIPCECPRHQQLKHLGVSAFPDRPGDVPLVPSHQSRVSHAARRASMQEQLQQRQLDHQRGNHAALLAQQAAKESPPTIGSRNQSSRVRVPGQPNQTYRTSTATDALDLLAPLDGNEGGSFPDKMITGIHESVGVQKSRGDRLMVTAAHDPAEEHQCYDVGSSMRVAQRPGLISSSNHQDAFEVTHAEVEVTDSESLMESNQSRLRSPSFETTERGTTHSESTLDTSTMKLGNLHVDYTDDSADFGALLDDIIGNKSRGASNI
mmetsp:Transcript_15653/g.42175  ORF Transcript_15653/g.42175 Transcript_15653/m.42175 type:complete len:844 (+) Transcript_15653:183-2714(+)